MNETNKNKINKRNVSNVSNSILSYFCNKNKNNECPDSDKYNCSTISNDVSSSILVHIQTIRKVSELILLLCLISIQN